MKHVAQQPPAGSQNRRRPVATAVNYALMTLAAAVFVSPIVFMVVGSLKPDERVLAEAGSWRALYPAQASLQNYADVFKRVPFWRYFLNSLVITGSIVAGGLIINSLAGYAFARLRWRGRDALLGAVLALMILPLQSIAVPLFYEVTILGWRDTYIAQILPFVANAFAVYLFYSFFIGLPRELEEAAWTDRAGVLRTFVEVVVPNAKPVFATVAVILFLFFWGLFLWPLMVTSGPEVRPLPVAIADFQTLPPLKWGDIMAFGVMMVLPVLILFFVFQRWFVRGVAASGLKG
jgi:multiple sugar transport system permease protein